MKKISYIVLLLILFLVTVVCPEAFGSVAILHVRHWTAPDHTRVVLDVSGETSYTVARADHRIYVDMKGAVLPGGIPHTYDIDKPAVKKINLTSLPKRGVRVELQVVLLSHQLCIRKSLQSQP